MLIKKYNKEQLKFIISLRDEGESYQDIADKYNDEYDPTPLKTSQAMKDAYRIYGGSTTLSEDTKAGNRTKELRAIYKDDMLAIAKDINKDLQDITKKDFLKNSEMTSYELLLAGGFAALKKLYFPKQTLNPTVDTGSKMIQAYRSKLTKQYGTEAFMKEEFLSVLDSILKKHPPKIYQPPKPTKAKKIASRTIVAHLSDLHYGANISKAEMGGVNEYNWVIAARRTAFFIDQVVKYKSDHRKDTDLALCLNGDIIAGLIHDQEWFADLGATQFSASLSMLCQAISYLANHFSKVRVYCTTGNHGRSMHKTNKGRAATHKWDSYETWIYVAIKQAMEAHSNVDIHIPEQPYADFEVQGHRIFLTHGDTVINPGNPGKSINMANVLNQVNKLNTSLADRREDRFEVIMVGHVHTPTIQLMDNGCTLLVNGCLSGTDPFAQSIGIFGNNPTQQIFEATKEHAVGDIRMIQVKEADNNKALDKIIKPFKGKF
jgi:predicted phosphodiesterase